MTRLQILPHELCPVPPSMLRSHAAAIRLRMRERRVAPAPAFGVEPGTLQEISTGPMQVAHVREYRNFRALQRSLMKDCNSALAPRIVAQAIAASCLILSLHATDVTDLHRGSPEIIHARQIAMYAARLKGLSFPQIGRALGRHHTTVLHAYRRVERIKDDPNVAAQIAAVVELIGARAP